MGQKVPPGLVKRGDIWHIKKTICGKRVQESAGTGNLSEAEKYMIYRIEQMRQSVVYGVRPQRSFREAATKYLKEATKTSIAGDVLQLKLLDPFIGGLALTDVHMGSLQQFIEARRKRE